MANNSFFTDMDEVRASRKLSADTLPLIEAKARELVAQSPNIDSMAVTRAMESVCLRAGVKDTLHFAHLCDTWRALYFNATGRRHSVADYSAMIRGWR